MEEENSISGRFKNGVLVHNPVPVRYIMLLVTAATILLWWLNR